GPHHEWQSDRPHKDRDASSASITSRCRTAPWTAARSATAPSCSASTAWMRWTRSTAREPARCKMIIWCSRRCATRATTTPSRPRGDRRSRVQHHDFRARATCTSALTTTDYQELGALDFDEPDQQRVTRRLVDRLEAFGYTVQLDRPAA